LVTKKSKLLLDKMEADVASTQLGSAGPLLADGDILEIELKVDSEACLLDV